MATGVQRLDAASRAQVEGRARRALQHQPAEGHGGSAHAEHVILRERVAQRQLAEVGDDPPLGRAQRVDEGVGAQVDRRGDACVVAAQEAELLRPVEPQRREGGLRRLDGRRAAEHEQRRQRAEWRRLAAGERPLRRNALAAVQRLRRLLAPQVGEGGDGEPRPGQVGTECRDRCGAVGG